MSEEQAQTVERYFLIRVVAEEASEEPADVSFYQGGYEPLSVSATVGVPVDGDNATVYVMELTGDVGQFLLEFTDESEVLQLGANSFANNRDSYSKEGTPLVTNIDDGDDDSDSDDDDSEDGDDDDGPDTSGGKYALPG